MNCCILRIINGMTYKTLQLVKLFCFISSSKEEVIQTLKKGGWNIIILWQTDEGTHTTWARTMYTPTYLKVFQDCSRYYVYIIVLWNLISSVICTWPWTELFVTSSQYGYHSNHESMEWTRFLTGHRQTNILGKISHIYMCVIIKK